MDSLGCNDLAAGMPFGAACLDAGPAPLSEGIHIDLPRKTLAAAGSGTPRTRKDLCASWPIARQEEPEKVVLRLPGEPDREYWRGALGPTDGALGDIPQFLLDEPTIPPGHGEAFHDAFARLHREFEKDVRKYNAGEPFDCDGSKYANIDDGVKHMKFVEAAVQSANSGSQPVAL